MKPHYFLGDWTNKNSDLILSVFRVNALYDNGDVNVAYRLMNKRNGIVYEVKTHHRLKSDFFKINTWVSDL